ncbi:MAG: hypothetical protein C0469_00435 [Cyanobacteria bacterium DS2.3.42]|nr:hypothetical protein [Cyanobacteria bacterium DS2.3.42]
MPRVRKPDDPPRLTPQLNTRLSAADLVKLENVCRVEGKTKTEVLRKAVLIYLDSYDKKAEEAKRDRLAESMESMASAIKMLSADQHNDTERLAKMIARVMMDVGTVQQVFFDRAAKDTRKELWAAAKRKASERLQHKRKGGDPEATEIMNHALGREA